MGGSHFNRNFLFCIDDVCVVWYTRTDFFFFLHFYHVVYMCVIQSIRLTPTRTHCPPAPASYFLTHSPTHRSSTSACLIPSSPLARASRLSGISLAQGT